MISSLFYNGWTRDDLPRFVDYHSDYHAKYLLYGAYEWPQYLKDQVRPAPEPRTR